MNDPDRAELERYVRWMADELGLRDWTLILSHDPPKDEDAGGEIEPRYARKVATVKVAKDFRELTPEYQRHVIVHELLHLHVEGAAVIVRNDLWEGRLVSYDAYQAIWYAYRTQMELGVDGIAERGGEALSTDRVARG